MGKKEKKQAENEKEKKEKKQAESEDEGKHENEDESESEDECKQSEDESHEDESEDAESESEDESEDEDGNDDDDHADAQQDVKLIKKMIAQYLGDGAGDLSKDESEALHALGHEAYQAHKEMGKEDEAAFKHAGEAVALANHMTKKAAKQSKHESEDEDGDTPPPKKKSMPPPKKKAPPSDDSGSDDDDDDDDSSAESEKKESTRVKTLKKRLLETEGRLVALEAKSKRVEVDGYVDRKLKESKQPRFITRRFKEAAGKITSKSDFDTKWKIFLEGVQNTRPEVNYGLMLEKAAASEDGSRSDSKKAFDFSGCAE